MSQFDFPGPGELPDHIPAEADIAPVTDGEHSWGQDYRRRTLELRPVRQYQAEESHEVNSEGTMRRTSTERDALPIIRSQGDLPEARQDYTANDSWREASYDPAQDDSDRQCD